MQCSDVKNALFEFASGDLRGMERSAIDAHLTQCAECTRTLERIWEMERLAMEWQDLDVPAWDRRNVLPSRDQAPGWWHLWLPVASLTVSVFVLVIVALPLIQTGIGWPDLARARADPARADPARSDQDLTAAVRREGAAPSTRDLAAVDLGLLERRLRELQLDQQQYVTAVLERQDLERQETDQLLLRALLETTREERHQEMGDLATLFSRQQQRQRNMTEESLRYLIERQVAREQELQDLSRAIEAINVTNEE